MRTARLVRVAAKAEILLVRRVVSALVRRAIYGAVAAVFAIAVLVLLHVLAVMALERFAGLSPIVSVAVVLVLDLIVAGVFGLLAAGKVADPVAEEARRVRDTSLEQARQSLTLAALIAPATRVVAQTGLVRVVAQVLGAGLRRGRK